MKKTILEGLASYECPCFTSCFKSAVQLSGLRMEVASLCESPIEAHLGSILAMVLEQAAALRGTNFRVWRGDLNSEPPANHLLLIPQFRWKRWRYDFALRHSNFEAPSVLIECDGKEFHSTTEQLANDNRKDEEAYANMIHMLRFPGRLIYSRPVWCVEQVVKHI